MRTAGSHEGCPYNCAQGCARTAGKDACAPDAHRQRWLVVFLSPE